MIRIALTYGAIAGAVIITSMVIGFALSDGKGFGSSQILGYLFMIVALSLIFIGIKRYRDRDLGGVISFGKAFQLGLLISLVASVAYIICWEAYLAATDYSFITTYVDGLLAKYEAEGMPADEIARKAEELQQINEMYQNPLTRILITFTEIFPVALIVTLVSAAILRNPKVLPARG
ncbi:DUF4199 domain-containing protein [Parvularcula sp. IMCC14364]|uniref:DUF4199 domain-containing protein n=1 Tax=Parvularcula sp. IMCC14364 TaxID=3067902 RepID=UPI002741EF1F|nr:DUF4199 domain-containing protein [Parvularcula sp. IMCC14364]